VGYGTVGADVEVWELVEAVPRVVVAAIASFISSQSAHKMTEST